MECGSQFVKILLFFFNFIFVICGLALVALGAVTLTIFKDKVELLKSNFSNGCVAIIVAGVVIFIVAFLGCCGAIQESRILLIIFGLCLIILLVAQIILSITIYIYRSKVDEIVNKSMSDAVKAYQSGNDSIIHMLVDRTQNEFKCCGVNNSSDWGTVIPNSCCFNYTICNSTLAFQQGCWKTLSTKVVSQMGILAAVALLICLLEIIGMILAFFLSKSISEEYEKI